MPTTATVRGLPDFADITGIALGLAVVIAVALALVIDSLRGRSSKARTE